MCEGVKTIKLLKIGLIKERFKIPHRKGDFENNFTFYVIS